MNDTPPASNLEQQLREMNEALLVSSVHHHELAEQARKAEAALRDSEIRYRRLFQSAKDGILILDATTGKIIDANAFISGLLGRELPELLGKELHEIGMFGDEAANKAVLERLQEDGYLRHDDLPARKPNGETTPGRVCRQRLLRGRSDGGAVQRARHHRAHPTGAGG